MKKVVAFLSLLLFVQFSSGEQLDPYGSCLTNVNKIFKKEMSKCYKNFYEKMLSAKDTSKGADYAQMFRACLEKSKADYEIGKTNCEVLYRE